MLNKKLVWYFLMSGSIAAWIFIIAGLIIPLEVEMLKSIWQVILLIWAIGHPLELFTSIPIGKNAGLSVSRTIIKTLLYGFTWWLPLKLGVLKD